MTLTGLRERSSVALFKEEFVRRPLHPDIRRYLDAVASLGRPAVHTLEPSIARVQYRESRVLVTPDAPEVGASEDREMRGPHGPIRLRFYRPLDSRSNELLPALIYFHGGGWTVGDLDTHDVLCRQICNQTPCAVVSVEYHLAPEHRFPIAVEEAIAATKWISENAGTLGLDHSRIAVGGDSAGGNLAAVVALDARDKKLPRLMFQLLIYPATDQSAETSSHIENSSGYGLTRDSILYFRSNYIDAKYFNDWRASPLRARDFSGLPPALVITAGYDPLVDEGKAYVEKLKTAGVPVEAVCFEDMIHGFVRLGRVVPAVQAGIDLCARSLARTFSLAPTKGDSLSGSNGVNS